MDSRRDNSPSSLDGDQQRRAPSNRDARVRDRRVSDRRVQRYSLEERAVREQPTDDQGVWEPRAQIQHRSERRIRGRFSDEPHGMRRAGWEQPTEDQRVWEPRAPIEPKSERRLRGRRSDEPHGMRRAGWEQPTEDQRVWEPRAEVYHRRMTDQLSEESSTAGRRSMSLEDRPGWEQPTEEQRMWEPRAQIQSKSERGSRGHLSDESHGIYPRRMRDHLPEESHTTGRRSEDRPGWEQPTEDQRMWEPRAQIRRSDRRPRDHISEEHAMGRRFEDRPVREQLLESRRLRERPIVHPHDVEDRRVRDQPKKGSRLRNQGDSPDGDRAPMNTTLRRAWIHGKMHGDKAADTEGNYGQAAGGWISYDASTLGNVLDNGEQLVRTVHQYSGTKKKEKEPEYVKLPLEPAVTLESISSGSLVRELTAKSELENGIMPLIRSIDYPDAVVLVDDVNFPVHLSVLQCFSDFFKRIVRSVYKFPVNFVSVEIFPLIYSWMIHHPDQSYRIFTRTNVLKLFVAARNFSIRALEEQCWVFLDDIRVFDENYAYFTMVEASTLNLLPISEMMFERVKRFFIILVASQDYLLLNVDDLCRLLSSSYIQINCETEVYASAVRWLKHDWTNRQQHTVRVMGCVRFGLIPPHTLVNLKQKHWNPEIFAFEEVKQRAGRGLTHSILFYGSVGQKANFLRMRFEDDRRNFSGIQRRYQNYQEFNNYLSLLQGYCLASLEIDTGVYQPAPRRAPLLNRRDSDESDDQDLQSDPETPEN